MCKNLDGENLANFWSIFNLPNFSSAKVSLHMVMDILLHLPKWDVTFKTKDISKNII